MSEDDSYTAPGEPFSVIMNFKEIHLFQDSSDKMPALVPCLITKVLTCAVAWSSMAAVHLNVFLAWPGSEQLVRRQSLATEGRRWFDVLQAVPELLECSVC